MPPELSIAQRRYVEMERTKSIYRRFLMPFARELCGYKDLTWRTHLPVIKALESETRRKLIVMPRGTFKSSLCSVAYPLWLLCSNPDLRIMLDSELYSNSKNFLREIKAHMQSAEMERLYGRWHNADCWNESEIIVRQRTRVLKEASITASGIGAEKTGQHFDVIICDDLNSPNNSSSPEGCDKVIRHFRFNQAILEPDGILVVVATRYSAMDIPGFVLRNELGLMNANEAKAHEANRPISNAQGDRDSGDGVATSDTQASGSHDTISQSGGSP